MRGGKVRGGGGGEGGGEGGRVQTKQSSEKMVSLSLSLQLKSDELNNNLLTFLTLLYAKFIIAHKCRPIPISFSVGF